MSEQRRLAQERLRDAAKLRREKQFLQIVRNPIPLGWEPYGMGLLFGLALLGTHALHVSSIGHRLLYMAIVVAFYIWAMVWVRRQSMSG